MGGEPLQVERGTRRKRGGDEYRQRVVVVVVVVFDLEHIT